MLSDKNKALVQNLKGNVAKILSANSAILREEEKSGLEGVYHAIDSLILSEKNNCDILTFQDELLLHLKYLQGTRKNSIKNKIIPKIEEAIKLIGRK